MDFDLSQEQILLQGTVRRFVSEQCPREFAQELERSGDFPRTAWRQMSELGLLGLPVPESHGGSAGNMLDMVIVIEELAQAALALAIPFINTVGLSSKVLCSLGSEKQKREILSQIITGEVLTSFAWTEASGGTDVLSMRTRAQESTDGEFYLVNGSKMFITQAHQSDFIYTMVRTDAKAEKKTQGLSCLMIPAGLDGISIREIEKTGQKSTGFCEIQFDDVAVPVDALLGDEGQGWKQMVPLLNGERTCFAAVCLGIAEAAFADAVKYMEQRSAFGKTINHFQILQHYIAEMKTLIDTSRLLVYKAAWLEAQGKPDALIATEAFLAAATMVSRVTDLGMQIMGGYGYTTEFDMERYWRDARVFRLSPISSEMAKNFIAQSLGMPRSY
jgi:acyl-CoA dehydrogenase